MIKDFGWSESRSQLFAPFSAQGFVPGRVTVQQRGVYSLATDFGDLSARLSGKMAHDAPDGRHPAVGDWVAIAARPQEGAATIHAVLPRRSLFARKELGGHAAQAIAANVDVAFIVTSMNAELNPRRLERYLAAAWASGAKPLVVLTKADICADRAALIALAQSVAFGVPILAVSAATGEGMVELAGFLRPGETCVLVGSSGVGKSTLVNALAGEEVMSTGAIRENDAKGRHTTTHRELLRLTCGALVLDTPGMRELGLFEAEAGFAAAFDDIEQLAASCRFRDCGHTNEPGCAVNAALDDGSLNGARWKSFQKLRRELVHEARKGDHAALAAEHKRWVAITKAQRAGRKLQL